MTAVCCEVSPATVLARHYVYASTPENCLPYQLVTNSIDSCHSQVMLSLTFKTILTRPWTFLLTTVSLRTFPTLTYKIRQFRPSTRQSHDWMFKVFFMNSILFAIKPVLLSLIYQDQNCPSFYQTS